MEPDALLDLLRRFQQEGVQYILVGGQAVRLNGFVRATEDIAILLPSSIDNGRRVIRALSFLPSSQELEPEWFAVTGADPENIRVADDLLIDLLFAANGHTYESLQDHVRSIVVEGVDIRTLDIAEIPIRAASLSACGGILTGIRSRPVTPQWPPALTSPRPPGRHQNTCSSRALSHKPMGLCHFA